MRKLLEEHLLLRDRHANPSIRNAEADCCACTNRLAGGSKRNCSLFGKLDGIAQQIEQHLPEPDLIDVESPNVIGAVNLQLVGIMLGLASALISGIIWQQKMIEASRRFACTASLEQ